MGNTASTQEAQLSPSTNLPPLSDFCVRCKDDFVTAGGCGTLSAALSNQLISDMSEYIPEGCAPCDAEPGMMNSILADCSLPNLSDVFSTRPAVFGFGHSGMSGMSGASGSDSDGELLLTDFCYQCATQFISSGGCSLVRAEESGADVDMSSIIPSGCEECDTASGVMDFIQAQCGSDAEVPSPAEDGSAPVMSEFCSNCVEDFAAGGGCDAIMTSLQATAGSEEVNLAEYIPPGCEACDAEPGFAHLLESACHLELLAAPASAINLPPTYAASGAEDVGPRCIELWLGDGECDDINDIKDCAFDGGDCTN